MRGHVRRSWPLSHAFTTGRVVCLRTHQNRNSELDRDFTPYPELWGCFPNGLDRTVYPFLSQGFRGALQCYMLDKHY